MSLLLEIAAWVLGGVIAFYTVAALGILIVGELMARFGEYRDTWGHPVD